MLGTKLDYVPQICFYIYWMLATGLDIVQQIMLLYILYARHKT